MILAFDVGGTHIKGGLVRDGAVVALVADRTDERDGARGVLTSVTRLGERLMAIHDVTAVGVAIRGIVDAERGVLSDVNEPLTSLIGRPVAALIARELRRPTYVENDARMYALGELTRGAGRGSSSMVCLTLGTGIGSGVALGGRVLRGTRGVAGILGGHLTVQAGGPRCTCGNIGCLEALIGTAGLISAARVALAGSDSISILRDGVLDPRRIFAAAAGGDRLAGDVVRQFAAHLGAGVVTLIHAHDPDTVVLGGGMMRSSAQFLPAVRAYVDTHAWTLPRGRVSLIPAALGDAAALVGVAELARNPDLLL